MIESRPLAFLTTTFVPPRPKARLSYLSLSAIYRTFTSTPTAATTSHTHHSGFSGPYTSTYDAGEKTSGPLGDASILGAPRITPKVLKTHLDNFVVGQERAKKILSVAVYNHYKRVQEVQRREEEEQELWQQELRREMSEGDSFKGSSRIYFSGLAPELTVADEFLGRQSTIHLHPPKHGVGAAPITDTSPLTIDKSNILLLGPSGVGKTLMAKTLARILAVPISMSDCTPFTQAGYIGEDVEVCVQRLLAAANYDVAAAERGIICLDEIDKISAARDSHGKDIAGEGVQQALLKIIEGTTLQIQAKQEKSSRGPWSPSNGYSPNSPFTGGGMGPTTNGSSPFPGPLKAETFNIRTDNILFIFAGAFVGLQKMVMNRIAKGSIGFGSPLRSSTPSSAANKDTTISAMPGSEESRLFEKHLPFFTTLSPDQPRPTEYNPLDLVEPTDLQTYGLIPELVGRIPVSAALSALDEDALVRVLTEPRNSLIRQYEQLFQLSGVELHFTQGSLREIARSTLGIGTGARGLRTICERLLTEVMFDAPGSSIKYVLITQAVAQRKREPYSFARGQQHKFHSLIAAEEEEFDAQLRKERGASTRDGPKEAKDGESHASFEEYRGKTKAAGVI